MRMPLLSRNNIFSVLSLLTFFIMVGMTIQHIQTPVEEYARAQRAKKDAATLD